MKRLATTVLSSMLALVAVDAAHAQADVVHYRVRLALADRHLAALAVTLEIPARVGETLTLDLPALVAADRAAAGLAVDGATLAPVAPAADKLTLHATASTVTLHYRLASDGSDSAVAEPGQPATQPCPAQQLVRREGRAGAGAVAGRPRADARHAGLRRQPGRLDDHDQPCSGPEASVAGRGGLAADRRSSLQADATRGGRHDAAPSPIPRACRTSAARSAPPPPPPSTPRRACWWPNGSSWRAPPQPFFIGLVQMKYAGDFGGRGLHGGFTLYMGAKVL